MFKNGHLLDSEDLAEEFANHFEDKINSLMSHVVIDFYFILFFFIITTTDSV